MAKNIQLLEDSTGPTDPVNELMRTGCAVILRNLLNALTGTPVPSPAFKQIAADLRVGYPAWQRPQHVKLTLARLYEQAGDPEAALRTVRERPYHHWFTPGYLSTFLREEGRLAAMVGDTAGAIRAYRHYLTLRSDPEPVLAAEVEEVREALDALLPPSSSSLP